MATPILSETCLTLSQVARDLPGRGGKAVNASTVFRWARTGVRLHCGRRLRLEAVRVGATWFTSREAVARFIDGLSAENSTVDLPRSPASRHHDAGAAAGAPPADQREGARG